MSINLISNYLSTSSSSNSSSQSQESRFPNPNSDAREAYSSEFRIKTSQEQVNTHISIIKFIKNLVSKLDKKYELEKSDLDTLLNSLDTDYPNVAFVKNNPKLLKEKIVNALLYVEEKDLKEIFKIPVPACLGKIYELINLSKDIVVHQDPLDLNTLSHRCLSIAYLGSIDRAFEYAKNLLQKSIIHFESWNKEIFLDQLFALALESKNISYLITFLEENQTDIVKKTILTRLSKIIFEKADTSSRYVHLDAKTQIKICKSLIDSLFGKDAVGLAIDFVTEIEDENLKNCLIRFMAYKIAILKDPFTKISQINNASCYYAKNLMRLETMKELVRQEKYIIALKTTKSFQTTTVRDTILFSLCDVSLEKKQLKQAIEAANFISDTQLKNEAYDMIEDLLKEIIEENEKEKVLNWIERVEIQSSYKDFKSESSKKIKIK